MSRSTALHPKALPLPRGWILLGAGLVSWGLVALAWMALSNLFHFVLGAI